MKTLSVRAAALACALSCACPLLAATPVGVGPRATAPTATPAAVARPATAAPKPKAAAAAPKAPAKPKKSTRPAPPPRLPVLKPGEYRWWPELAPEGPVAMVVSLPEQRVSVYRNGVRIGVSTISSGKRGFETRTGVFPIIERERDHHSNLYDDAPMPFMLRLTYSGTALHAGKLPGYPASHGCIRLPAAFAEKLFDASRRGTVVVVADAASQPPEVVSPEWLTPIDVATGAAIEVPAETAAEDWAPERAPEGPLTVVLSTRDHRLVALRNGIEIGHADAEITGAPVAGTQLYSLQAVAGEGADRTAGTDLPDPPPTLRWQGIAMPGKPPAAGAGQLPLRGGQIRVSDTFAQQLQAVLPADATLVITDEALRHARAPAAAPATAPASTPALTPTPAPLPAAPETAPAPVAPATAAPPAPPAAPATPPTAPTTTSPASLPPPPATH